MAFLRILAIIGALFLHSTKANNAANVARKNIKPALEAFIEAGGLKTDGLAFLYTAWNYHFNSSQTALRRQGLLANKIIGFMPEDYFVAVNFPYTKYATWASMKFAIYFRALMNDPTNFAKIAAEVMFPQDDINSTGLQDAIDQLIKNASAVVEKYNLDDNDEWAGIDWLLDMADAPAGIRGIFNWIEYMDKNDVTIDVGVDTMIEKVLTAFDFYPEIEELANTVKGIHIPEQESGVPQMIMDFCNTDYVPERFKPIVGNISENWDQFKSFPPGGLAVFEWVFWLPEYRDRLPDALMDEGHFIMNFINKYLFKNLTQMIYANDTNTMLPYLFNAITGYINSTSIKPQWKTFWTILAKHIDDVNYANESLIWDELDNFVRNTDLWRPQIKAFIVALMDEEDETVIYQKFKDYIQVLYDEGLNAKSKAWYDGTLKGYTTFDQIQMNKTSVIENMVLMFIDMADVDTETFTDFSSPFWPNNMIHNLNRVASNITNFENDPPMFTLAIFESITDMYPIWSYPDLNLLNATQQIMGAVLEDKSITDNGRDFTKYVLTTLKNTLAVTDPNGVDLIFMTQLYMDVGSDNVTLDNMIDFLENNGAGKPIRDTLLTVLKAVNETIHVIDNSVSDNIFVDINDAVDFEEFLPFFSDLVDAIVGTLFPEVGSRIVASIDGLYDFLTKPVNLSTIFGIVDPLGAMISFMVDPNEYVQNRYDKAMDLAETILTNIANVPDYEDVQKKIYKVLDQSVTQAPIDSAFSNSVTFVLFFVAAFVFVLY